MAGLMVPKPFTSPVFEKLKAVRLPPCKNRLALDPVFDAAPSAYTVAPLPMVAVPSLVKVVPTDSLSPDLPSVSAPPAFTVTDFPTVSVEAGRHIGRRGGDGQIGP